MSTYTVVPRPGADGFDVAVVGTNGVHQRILGFKTEAEAEAWIAQDTKLNGAAGNFLPRTAPAGRRADPGP